MILGQMTTAYPVSLPSAEGWSFISARGVVILIGVAVAVSILFSIFRARKQNVNGVPGWTEVILDAVFAPIVALVGFVIGFVVKCTGDKSFIAFGCLSLYFLGLNVEGYYQALGNNATFIPVPFVTTNADINDLFNAINTDFWGFAGACVFSICIQAYQAWALRDADPEINKKRHAEAARHTVPPANKDGLDIAEVHRQRYKSSGMKMEFNVLVGLIFSWLIDGGVALKKYPIFPFTEWQGFGNFAVSLILIVITIFGAEVAIASYQKGREENRLKNSGVTRVSNP
jgi:cbb3-type cytochrome oxidase subunit 3